MLDFNLNSLSRQLEEIEQNSGKQRTDAETRKYIIHLFGVLQRLVAVYDQFLTFPDWNPVGRAYEREAIKNIPDTFAVLMGEVYTAGDRIFNLSAMIEEEGKT